MSKEWTTNSGEKILISEMTDNHLHNAIRYLERRAEAERCDALVSGYSLLAMLQGEMAIMQVESDIRQLEDYGIDPVEISPLYDDLCEEQFRRLGREK